MIQSVFGIKQFQVNLPKLARQIREVGGHYLVTNRSVPEFVAIPFADYQQIEDILLELNSPKLLQSIGKGRKEYRAGKSTPFRDLLKKTHG